MRNASRKSRTLCEGSETRRVAPDVRELCVVATDGDRSGEAEDIVRVEHIVPGKYAGSAVRRRIEL